MNRESSTIIALHESEYYGIIVEVGAGVPIAQAIYNLPGASATVYSALSPYSKEAQEEIFGKSENRAVSQEHVREDIITLIGKYKNNDKINFIYHSSFQIGEVGSNVSTHGWVGVAKKVPHDRWNLDLIHISLHKNEERESTIEKLGSTCLSFLELSLLSKKSNWALPSKQHIDIFSNYELWSDGGQTNGAPFTAQELPLRSVTERVINSIGDDGYVAMVDGKMVRLEDVFRDKPEVTLYKGSFNPPTRAHMEFVTTFEGLKKYKPGTVAFMISMDTFDKGEQQAMSVVWRAKMINELGYPVIINRNGFFYDNAEFFRKKFGKPINFLVGSDTINRTIEWAKGKGGVEARARLRTGIADYVAGFAFTKPKWSFTEDTAFDGVTFWVANRPNIPVLPEGLDPRVKIIVDLDDISSTMVRQYKEEGNLEGLKLLMPAEIIDCYLNISL